MFQEQLQNILRRTLHELVNNGKLSLVDEQGLHIVSEPVVEIPKDEAHGDFASNAAMMLAKAAKKPPRAIAELIAASVNEPNVIEKIEIAGPGFLNFYLKKDYISSLINEIHKQKNVWGRCNIGNGKRVLLEFVSANPTGPLNVVNARAATVGDVLANLFEHCGYDVEREYYVNDEGSQIDNLGKSLQARFEELQGEPLVIPPDGYNGLYLIDIAKELLDSGHKIDEQKWSDVAVSKLLEQQKGALERFGVYFNRFFRQSELTSAGKHLESFNKLKENGFVSEQDGAFWLATTRFGDDKDRVLVRSTGEHTYFSVDIAYHLNKAERGYNHLINLLGPDHHGYIPRLKACMEALGYPDNLLELYIIQQVTLLKGGEVVKMSKRAGEFITMNDLIEEVETDAARFFFNLRHRDSPLEFDLDLAKSQSDDNPLYYVQYAHARIKSILRNAQEQGVSLPDDMAKINLSLLSAKEETTLIKLLDRFPILVRQCMEKRETHHLTTYGGELARAFHAFYTVHRVLSGPTNEQSQARLALIDAVRMTIANLLKLMGISAPDKM